MSNIPSLFEVAVCFCDDLLLLLICVVDGITSPLVDFLALVFDELLVAVGIGIPFNA